MKIDNLQIIILAGGLGTRLRPMTLTMPKPMIKILGKPFLEHQILLLKKNGAQNFLILCGYLGEQISQYFGNGRRWGIHINYSQEQQPLGTAGAIKRASSLIEDQFLLLNGDSYLATDYGAILKKFSQTNLTGLLSLYDNRNQSTGVEGNIFIDPQGYIERYQKSSAVEQTPLVDAGASIWNKTLLREIPDSYPLSLENNIFPKLIETKKLGGFTIKERFYDMGTPSRLLEFQKFLTHYYKNHKIVQ